MGKQRWLCHLYTPFSLLDLIWDYFSSSQCETALNYIWLPRVSRDHSSSGDCQSAAVLQPCPLFPCHIPNISCILKALEEEDGIGTRFSLPRNTCCMPMNTSYTKLAARELSSCFVLMEWCSASGEGAEVVTQWLPDGMTEFSCIRMQERGSHLLGRDR